MYVNDLICVARLLNALVQQLCLWETVGFVDVWDALLGERTC